jgi:hypothetical protein
MRFGDRKGMMGDRFGDDRRDMMGDHPDEERYEMG